jgi:sulfur carrier protein
MLLFINDISREVSENETISGILLSLDLKQSKGIALAVNNEIIFKDKWESFKLNNNDRITIIKASQGG